MAPRSQYQEISSPTRITPLTTVFQWLQDYMSTLAPAPTSQHGVSSSCCCPSCIYKRHFNHCDAHCTPFRCPYEDPFQWLKNIQRRQDQIETIPSRHRHPWQPRLWGRPQTNPSTVTTPPPVKAQRCRKQNKLQQWPCSFLIFCQRSTLSWDRPWNLYSTLIPHLGSEGVVL